jgi:hypothetical protein
LARAEQQYSQTPKAKLVVTLAREATQIAEDARLITLRKKKAAESAQAAGREPAGL